MINLLSIIIGFGPIITALAALRAKGAWGVLVVLVAAAVGAGIDFGLVGIDEPQFLIVRIIANILLGGCLFALCRKGKRVIAVAITSLFILAAGTIIFVAHQDSQQMVARVKAKAEATRTSSED